MVERQTPLPPPKDMMINELNLTELETKTLTTFIGGLYAEPGFSDVDVNDLLFTNINIVIIIS